MIHAINWSYGLILLAAAAILTMALSNAMGETGNLVSILQMRFQVSPGSTRVLPECGCTVRYLGTKVRGNLYTIQIQKLD